MKKILFGLVFALGLVAASAATYYHKPNVSPILAGDKGESILLLDATLANSDVVYSDVVDLLHVPIAWRDTGGRYASQAPAIFYDQNAGRVIVSCYDETDVAATVDTVNVIIAQQVSRYAVDNTNPMKNSALGSYWSSYSLAGATFNAASDANAVIDTTLPVLLTSETHRFLRVKLTNNKSDAGLVGKNVPRCRVYWTKKPIVR